MGDWCVPMENASAKGRSPLVFVIRGQMELYVRISVVGIVVKVNVNTATHLKASIVTAHSN